MTSQQQTHLLDPLFTTNAMRKTFAELAYLQAMLDFEAALAHAQARANVIPVAAVKAIESQCQAELFDLDTIGQATALAGNPAIPLVKELTERVAQANKEAARFVHWGATSQDVMDTGLVLQLRVALDLIESDLAALTDTIARLANTHKRTLLPGRTWLQHALPITLGVKVAGWLSALERDRARVRELRRRALVLQFGGAAGTLAALGDKGMTVATLLAEELKLALPDSPWHTQRDRIAEVATTLGLLVGTLGKMARDISLMMQTEIAEAFEPKAVGRGVSSTMAHKRNPVGAAVVLAAAVRVPPLVSTMLSAMTQEHERGVGGWHAEWKTLPDICQLTAGAIAQMAHTLTGWEVDSARMQKNIDLTQGLILAESVTMALATHMGRLSAHQLIEKASHRATEEGRHLYDVLIEDAQVKAHLSGNDLKKIFDPMNYLGVSEKIVETVLARRSEKR